MLGPNSDMEEIPSSPPPRRTFDAEGALHKQPIAVSQVADKRRVADAEVADDLRVADEAPPAEPRVVDHHISKIVLNKQLTGGHDRGNSSDGDLSVAFQPRNAAGQFVKATGDVSIVVLDPAVTGQASRVARWDYKPNELQAHLRSSDAGRGYYFDLHWPARPPAHGSLELFVRLKSADGQRLIANQTIQVDASHDFAAQSP